MLDNKQSPLLIIAISSTHSVALLLVLFTYANSENVIVPLLVRSAAPLHLFDWYCLKLKLISCALASSIGTTTTAADSIATAVRTASITLLSCSYYLLDN